jgi:hypothetical protein
MDEDHIAVPHLPDLKRLSRSHRNDIDPAMKPILEGWIEGLKEPRIIGTGGAGDFQPFPGQTRRRIEAEAEIED